jgi:hypothetical protein
MSMPHGTTSANEQSERWITDARKQMIPDKVDWTVAAANGAHIWLETDASGCFSPDCKVFVSAASSCNLFHLFTKFYVA